MKVVIKSVRFDPNAIGGLILFLFLHRCLLSLEGCLSVSSQQLLVSAVSMS